MKYSLFQKNVNQLLRLISSYEIKTYPTYNQLENVGLKKTRVKQD